MATVSSPEEPKEEFIPEEPIPEEIIVEAPQEPEVIIEKPVTKIIGSTDLDGKSILYDEAIICGIYASDIMVTLGITLILAELNKIKTQD